MLACSYPTDDSRFAVSFLTRHSSSPFLVLRPQISTNVLLYLDAILDQAAPALADDTAWTDGQS